MAAVYVYAAAVSAYCAPDGARGDFCQRRQSPENPAGAQRGGMVVALLDVLPEFVGVKAWREQRVPFLGRPARFPLGLLSAAARADATIVPFFGRVGADHQREFSFEEPCRVTELGETLTALVGLLEQYVRRYPYEWHHWPALQDFYRRAD